MKEPFTLEELDALVANGDDDLRTPESQRVLATLRFLVSAQLSHAVKVAELRDELKLLRADVNDTPPPQSIGDA